MAVNHRETAPQVVENAAQEDAKKGDLTQAETVRLFHSAADLLVTVGWDEIPRRLAVALAMHQVIDEQAPRIHHLALSVLQQLQKQSSDN
jgi:hypothetical protein